MHTSQKLDTVLAVVQSFSLYNISTVCMEVALVWSLFLPCPGPREKELWSARLEHCLRVQ